MLDSKTKIQWQTKKIRCISIFIKERLNNKMKKGIFIDDVNGRFNDNKSQKRCVLLKKEKFQGLLFDFINP